MVGKVDCTVHKDLCQKQGVQGYPTLKYSNGYGLNSYESGRDLESLLKFVEDNLQNGCLDDENLCTEEEVEQLEKYATMDTEALEAQLAQTQVSKEDAETLFRAHVQKLQDQYNTLSKEKTGRLKELSKEEAFLRHAMTNVKSEAESETKEEL